VAEPIQFLIGIMLLSGCQESKEIPSTLATNKAATSMAVDAGIVFSDRASYFCVPLSRLGVKSAEDAVEITSSCVCVCVKPSLVRYATSIHDSADGLRCEFVPDESSSSKLAVPVSLAITITLNTSDGTSRIMMVHFLSTHVQVAQNAVGGATPMEEHASMFGSFPKLTSISYQ